MNIISSVAEAMQTIFTSVADKAAKTSGFIKRKRKLTGSKFVQTLVFSWLANLLNLTLVRSENVILG